MCEGNNDGAMPLLLRGANGGNVAGAGVSASSSALDCRCSRLDVDRAGTDADNTGSFALEDERDGVAAAGAGAGAGADADALAVSTGNMNALGSTACSRGNSEKASGLVDEISAGGGGDE